MLGFGQILIIIIITFLFFGDFSRLKKNVFKNSKTILKTFEKGKIEKENEEKNKK